MNIETPEVTNSMEVLRHPSHSLSVPILRKCAFPIHVSRVCVSLCDSVLVAVEV